jgi:hypothetical protein
MSPGHFLPHTEMVESLTSGLSRVFVLAAEGLERFTPHCCTSIPISVTGTSVMLRFQPEVDALKHL